ncbi:hypothetical protein [Microcoleus sp. PH2017_36_ELK_O_B]|uniref:hypothetical protein n=1 Tax=Microcoleus sp. PH2017_36_ELK_O_B TaxID=2798846 RepID=UPI0025D15354|nr:hypothetical protein [Microcoleus sp. PH2017_36_ELK_O_B]
MFASWFAWNCSINRLISDRAKVSGFLSRRHLDDISIVGAQDWIDLWAYFLKQE